MYAGIREYDGGGRRVMLAGSAVGAHWVPLGVGGC